MDLPDGEAEQRRKRDHIRRLASIRAQAMQYIAAVDQVVLLLERGLTLPDASETLGLPPIVPRASRPMRPWRMRPDSNIAIIADMLEAAGRRGVSEPEMVAELERRGRLQDAKNPIAAVHWSVRELQSRTQFVGRSARARGGRWYAYGTLDAWRKGPKPKEISSKHQSST